MSPPHDGSPGDPAAVSQSPRNDTVAVDAEIAVIAAALSNPENFYDVAAVIGADDFAHPAHAAIWSAMVSCDAQGRPIEVLTVADELTRAGQLERAGGTERLDALIAAAGDTIGNTEAHARIVADRGLKRRVLDAARDIATAATQPSYTGTEALDVAEQRVFDLANNPDGSGPKEVKELLPETLSELTRARSSLLLGHSTGFAELDRLTSGYQAGQLVIVAARPGMGKSAMAMQTARTIAERSGDMVVVLNYEMSSSELLTRMLATSLGVDLMELRQGQLPPEAEADLSIAAQRLAGLPILIDDNPPPTISGVRALLRRLNRRGPLGGVIIDYLQLMSGDGGSKSENRTQEISEISRGLKMLARELGDGGIPIIALSQLNRQLEQRPDKRPKLSDLRESGSLEQDANLVLFVYRDAVYHPDADPSEAEFIVAKQRSGPAGVTVPVRWEPRCARFSDPDPSAARAVVTPRPSPGSGVRGQGQAF
jgi:replicative DNA helicase